LSHTVFAHQPEGILGQPAVGGLRLVQSEHAPDEVAQPIEKLALEGILGRFSCLRRIAAEGLGYGGAVGLNDERAEKAGVLVLAREHVEEGSPEIGKCTQPIEDRRVEDVAMQESCPRGKVRSRISARPGDQPTRGESAGVTTAARAQSTFSIPHGRGLIRRCKGLYQLRNGTPDSSTRTLSRPRLLVISFTA
jgi:hypothetical protein